jgi:CBS domain containing-hemolysin-like protein
MENVLWVVTIVTFALGAFYSGSETALIACNRIRMRHLADKGDKRAAHVIRLLDDPEYFLSAVLVGTNLAVIGCTTTFTAICTIHFGARGETVATLVLVPFFLLFNEIIPKGLFLYYANRTALGGVYALRALSTLLYPVIMLFSTFADLVTRLLPGKSEGRKIHLTMEELLFHIGDSGEAGLIPLETTILSKRAIELKELRAGDVMVSLDRVKMADYESSMEQFRVAFSNSGYSRLPVYRGDRRNVVGVVSVHELMRINNPDELRAQLVAPYSISPETPIVAILFEMKEQGRHMGVIRRDGEVVGMITLEDILERFVGAIADEFN